METVKNFLKEQVLGTTVGKISVAVLGIIGIGTVSYKLGKRSGKKAASKQEEKPAEENNEKPAEEQK